MVGVIAARHGSRLNRVAKEISGKFRSEGKMNPPASVVPFVRPPPNATCLFQTKSLSGGPRCAAALCWLRGQLGFDMGRFLTYRLRLSAMSPETMKWTILLVLAALVVIGFLLKQTSQIAPADALEYLGKGAMVVDVRSPGEYNTDHLPNTINIPLDVIESALPQRVGDKNQVLLLHCQSGVRSAIAMRRVKAIGYANAFNLGSLARAREILGKTL